MLLEADTEQWGETRVLGRPGFLLCSKYINNHTVTLHYIMNMWKHFYYFDRISEPKKKLSDLSASGRQLH